MAQDVEDGEEDEAWAKGAAQFRQEVKDIPKIYIEK